MKKSARIAAAGAAAVLTAAVGILGAASATAADIWEWSADGTRVTSVPDNRDMGDNREFGTDGTRVTSVQDNRDF
jgi:hypothetical protein